MADRKADRRPGESPARTAGLAQAGTVAPAADVTLSEFRQAYPPGSTGQVVAVDPEGRYAGLVIVAETHTPDLPNAASIRDLLRQADEMLSPTMTVQQAVAVFDRTECEALAVVDSFSSRKVIGLLTEA